MTLFYEEVILDGRATIQPITGNSPQIVTGFINLSRADEPTSNCVVSAYLLR